MSCPSPFFLARPLARPPPARVHCSLVDAVSLRAPLCFLCLFVSFPLPPFASRAAKARPALTLRLRVVTRGFFGLVHIALALLQSRASLCGPLSSTQRATATTTSLPNVAASALHAFFLRSLLHLFQFIALSASSTRQHPYRQLVSRPCLLVCRLTGFLHALPLPWPPGLTWSALALLLASETRLATNTLVHSGR